MANGNRDSKIIALYPTSPVTEDIIRALDLQDIKDIVSIRIEMAISDPCRVRVVALLSEDQLSRLHKILEQKTETVEL